MCNFVCETVKLLSCGCIGQLYTVRCLLSVIFGGGSEMPIMKLNHWINWKFETGNIVPSQKETLSVTLQNIHICIMDQNNFIGTKLD